MAKLSGTPPEFVVEVKRMVRVAGSGSIVPSVSGDIEQKADRLLAAAFVFFKGCGQDCGSIGGDQLNVSPVAEQEEL